MAGTREFSRLRLLLLGLLLGGVLCLPSFLMPRYRAFYQRHFPDHAAAWPNNGSFTHLAVYGGEGEDECFYAARAREAGERWLPYDPFVREDRDQKLLTRDILGFWFLGLLQRLTGDLNRTWVLARLLLVPAFFLLLFALLSEAGSRRGPAIFFAVSLTLFFEITVELIGFEAPLSALKGLVRKSLWLLGGEHNFFGPTRLLNPALSYPALLAAGLLAVRAARAQRPWAWALAAGLAGGALAYVHTNVWTTHCLAILVFWGGQSLTERRVHFPLLAAGLLVALCSLPWLALNVPPSLDTLERSVAAFGRRASPLSLFYFASAAIAWWAAGQSAARRFMACGLAATGLMLNISLFTGYYIVDYEWAFIGNLFLLAACAAALGGRLAEGPRWAWLTAMALVLGVARGASYSAHLFRSYALPAPYEEALRWLDRNAARDSVVATLSGEVTMLLPVYTGVKTLVARNQPLVSEVSNEENARRIGFALTLFVPESRREAAAATFLKTSGGDVMPSQMWLGAFDRRGLEEYPSDTFFSGFGHRVTYEAVRGVVARALAEPPASYSVDYLWVGPLERRLSGGGPWSPPPGRTRVFANDAVEIYR